LYVGQLSFNVDLQESDGFASAEAIREQREKGQQLFSQCRNLLECHLDDPPQVFREIAKTRRIVFFRAIANSNFTHHVQLQHTTPLTGAIMP
jgi:hypothetical protein